MELPLDLSTNKEPFNYIINLIRGKGELYTSPDGLVTIFPSIIKLTMPDESLFVFQERFNSGEIQCYYKYEDYRKDKNLQATIKELGLDPDCFWLLIMFCYDYACDVCLSGIRLQDTVKDIIGDFISKLPDENSPKNQLSVKSGKGKSTITNLKAISLIKKWIEQGYMDEMESLSTLATDSPDEMFVETEESNSVLIWYFASLLRYFFEINPQYKGRSKKCDTVSLNKLILISNLIYFTRLSRNQNFLNDDEALKGFFKQYKGKVLKSQSGIYPSF